MKNSNKNMTAVKIKVKNLGGVSFETRRSSYRGSVTLNGVRHRTKYFATRLGAKRALNKLITSLTSTVRKLSSNNL